MILKVVIYGPFRVIAAGTVKVGVLGPLKERLILMIPVILFQQPCQNPQCAPDPLKGIALSGTDFFPEKPGDRFSSSVPVFFVADQIGIPLSQGMIHSALFLQLLF